MFTLVYVAFVVWPLLTAVFFSVLGPRRGAMASMVGGFLFLPFVVIPTLDGLPPVDKVFVTSASVIAAVIAFDPKRLADYRAHWLDLFLLVAWIVWGASPLINGLGFQQALLEWWFYTFWAAVPYFIGRIYLVSPAALRDLAIVIVTGAALYAVLALIEMRMSPQIHNWVYGVAGAKFHTAYRMGGWRPRVFQYSGLALALFMCSGAVVAVALGYAQRSARVLGMPIRVVAPALVLIGFACRGAGAMALMAIAVASVIMARMTRRWAWALLIPGLVSVYLATAFIGPIVPVRGAMVEVSRVVFGDERAYSLSFRINYENALVWHAMRSPVVGWGGWGRNRLDIEDAREMTGRAGTVTDGFWIIVFGKYGLVGLIGVYGWMLVPASFAVVQLIRLRAGPSIGCLVVGLSLWSTMYAADQLLNGFPNQLQGLVAGGLAGFAIAAGRIRPRSTSPSRQLGRNVARRTLPVTPSRPPVASSS